ncbi:MAG: hypothetical protein KAR38_00580, partial [Calditrichia bacterium]|nr:hypothetical protein [Calditrichia bacterium]
IQFYNPETLESYVEFNGDTRNILTDNKEFNLDFSITTSKNPLNGHLYLANSQKKWLGFWDMKKYLHGDFKLEGQESLNIAPYLEMNLNVTSFPVFDYLALNTNYKWEALLNLDLNVKGKTDSLNGQINLALTDIILNHVGYYGLNLSGNFKNNIVKLTPVNISLNNVPVMKASVIYDMTNNTIDGELSGDSVQTSFLTETFFKRKNFMSGKADYYSRIYGNINNPKLNLKVKMPRAIVYDEEVENVYCEITDSLKNINIFKQKNHAVHVDTFSYNSVRGYSFTGNGYLPLSFTDSMRISARIDGNFLAHLPRIEKFFQKVDLNGYLEVEAYGSLKRPKIDYFDLEVENGSMEFREILKPLTN